jgi:peptide/nickel transport system ATP-binding protein
VCGVVSLLEVDNLSTEFATREGTACAVNGLSFEVRENETVAILGESGCGKSVTAMSILRLVREPPARISGSIRFGQRDLLALSKKEMQELRGNEISMIFQEPMTSLNPVLTVGRQIAETVRLHQGMDRHAAMHRAKEMLELVGIPDAARRLQEYPHQLSGGMRQRVMIAIALSCNPKLLIADEPTTALDVTIQAQVLDLLRDLKQRLGSAIVLITHDLGVVAEMAERVIVMYAGRKAEEARVDEIFRAPRHPYTRALLASIPKLRTAGLSTAAGRLAEIPGIVPSPLTEIRGCAFAERCSFATSVCRQVVPQIQTTASGHQFACHHADEVAAL